MSFTVPSFQPPIFLWLSEFSILGSLHSARLRFVPGRHCMWWFWEEKLKGGARLSTEIPLLGCGSTRFLEPRRRPLCMWPSQYFWLGTAFLLHLHFLPSVLRHLSGSGSIFSLMVMVMMLMMMMDYQNFCNGKCMYCKSILRYWKKLFIWRGIDEPEKTINSKRKNYRLKKPKKKSKRTKKWRKKCGKLK